MKVRAVDVVSLPAEMMRRDSPKRSSRPSMVLGVEAIRCEIKSGLASRTWRSVSNGWI